MILSSRPVRALWIEIMCTPVDNKAQNWSRPVRALWIEIIVGSDKYCPAGSRPVRALWIEIAIQTLRYYLIRCRGP